MLLQDARLISFMSTLFEGLSAELIRAALGKLEVLHSSKMYVPGSTEHLIESMKACDVGRFADISRSAIEMRIPPADIHAAAAAIA